MGNNAGSLKNHIATAEKTGALSFSEKRLDEFPSALQKASGVLRNLDLSKNKISALPSSIGSYKMLKTLRLSENRLHALPAEIGGLDKLESLFVSGNALVDLPSSMAGLRSLKVLDASANQLKTFPSFVTALKKLDVLDLSRNKIAALPDDLSGLSATELSINLNQVSLLPETLSWCPRLKTLRAEENCLPLEGVPTRMLSESKISTLQLAGNLFDEKKLADIDGYNKYMERYTAVKRKLD